MKDFIEEKTTEETELDKKIENININENLNENDENEDDENEKAEKEFEDKIKKDKYFEINKILKENTTPIKIWEYNTSEKDGSTILHLSVIKDNTKIIKEIIRYCKNHLSKADLKYFINKRNNSGITALHYASFKGNIDIINILIFYGADISILTDKSLNVIDFACQGNQPKSLVFFNYYYENQIDFNKLDIKESTPLHWACFSKSYECVDFLLNKGVEINAQDSNGFTPLHLAVVSDITRIVRLLLQNGVLTNIKNKKDDTPMSLALSKKRIEIYNLLKISSKCTVFNCKAPAKKIKKTKKYIFSALFFKFFTYFILFCFIFPFLYNKTCYIVTNLLGSSFFIINNLVFAIIYFFLICSDPGYIKDDDKITDIESLLFKQKNDFKSFCFKCSVIKTDNLKHCSICNKCCKEFDHHCFWVNNCIGKNNYLAFIVLLYICLIDFSYMILISVYSLLIYYEVLFFKQKAEDKKCNINNNIIDSIYKNIKNFLSYLNIDLDLIPGNTSFIALLSVVVIFLIPLLYLVILHTKLCKNKRKEKRNSKKIDLSIQNINPDELLEENSEHDTSLDSY